LQYNLNKKAMIREVVKIDEDLCNGCGVCVPACHEGALQIIDNKARLVSDLMCDGLGACLGHCPQGAIEIEKREAEPYNETKVMEIMVEKGKNTVIAHLKHLKDHNETGFLKEGVRYLKENEDQLSFDLSEVIREVHGYHHEHAGGGCPGSQAKSFEPNGLSVAQDHKVSGESALRQWPVQLHLLNPNASYFQDADVLVAADCVAYAAGDFHSKWLKDKTLAIACPKLDQGTESYIEKIRMMIDEARVNTISVMIMEVPCCRGLVQMVQMAAQQAKRKVPVKMIMVSVQGDILNEEWI
jgi:ferredoxin